ESGEYQLHVRAQDGRGDVKKLKLGEGASVFLAAVVSPEGKTIAYGDKRLNLWYVDLGTGKSTKVDTGPYDDDLPGSAVWSPDSRWLAYTRQLKNYLSSAFLYSLESGRANQITDGMSDARYVAFDKSGKYVFFTASTD